MSGSLKDHSNIILQSSAHTSESRTDVMKFFLVQLLYFVVSTLRVWCNAAWAIQLPGLHNVAVVLFSTLKDLWETEAEAAIWDKPV